MRTTGEYISKSILAAFVATLMMAALLWLQQYLMVITQFDLIQILSAALGQPDQPAVGWIAFFVIHTMLWGSLFGLFSPYLVGRLWLRGIEFSILAWIALMVIIMPVAQHDFFALDLNMKTPLFSLALYIIFGGMMGAVFSQLVLQRSGPAERLHQSVRL